MIQDPDDDGDEGLEVDFSVLTCWWAWLGRKMFNTEKPQKMWLRLLCKHNPLKLLWGCLALFFCRINVTRNQTFLSKAKQILM